MITITCLSAERPTGPWRLAGFYLLLRSQNSRCASLQNSPSFLQVLIVRRHGRPNDNRRGMPIGFATISGLVYAFIASPPLVWSHTCWSKMGRWMPRKVIHPGFSSESTYRFDLEGKSEIDMVCYALARSVTQGCVDSTGVGGSSACWGRRGSGSCCGRHGRESSLEQIAALHFLMWWKRVSAARGSDEIVQETAPQASRQPEDPLRSPQEAAPVSTSLSNN